ncbi:substrate-binding periplasmic protein [Vibrio sonorensis]|uniref:substrate-binding periplasmic protein n=1 Tax=Vibrio sonorensis TaxID=1004316 RepID=UPI0008D8ECCF|nr:transporter substrate-binding domain-containing protein [Vibrio sonorensis]
MHLFNFALMLMASSLHATQLNSLNYLTEEYPPYNYTLESKPSGISVKLLVAATELANSPIELSDIRFQPWARAYRSALVREDTVLFSTTRTDLREHLFQWVGPIIETRVVILAKRTSHIVISSPMELAQYRIGVIRDDVGEQILSQLGVPRNSLQESSHAKTLAKQIQKGRIDLWAYEERVARWWIKEAGYNPDDYEAVYVLEQGELYYAFNINANKELVAALQKAIDELKYEVNSDGVTYYEQILGEY